MRFDMTLLGFERMSWLRGHRSVIFTAQPSSRPGERVQIRMLNIDHDAKLAFLDESGVVCQEIEAVRIYVCCRPLDSLSLRLFLLSP